MSDNNKIIIPLIKGVSGAIVAGVMDRYAFNEQNLTHNLVFASTSAAGIAVGSIIGSQIPSVIDDTTFYSGKTISQRSFEVIFGSVFSYAAFYNSGFNYSPSDNMKRVGVVFVADFVSEYITDYAFSQPLQYLV